MTTAATAQQRDALARCLDAGGIALFGADTVYGLCCDPFDAAAVARLFALKGRAPAKPAALAFFSLASALEALPELGERTRRAFEALLPGPLTLLVPNPARRFPLAGGELLGVRVLDIGIELERPILQSSANLAGGPDPRTLDEVPAAIRAAADLEIDRGPLPGTPSTVVDLSRYESSGSWQIVRRGAFAGAEIRRALLGSQAMADDLPADYFTRPLAEVDPEIAEAVAGELDRQQNTLELIASENFVPYAVLEAAGSVLTNKYAEGYPGARYYGGCEYVDIAEQLAIDRAKALFGAEHANVQPHAGAQANAAVYHALLEPGDTIMGLALAHGGHLTHGMKKNVSGRLYEIVPYEVDRETSLIDMDALAALARERRPKLILAGWSAYPRQLDFTRFREIADEVGAYLMVDMAHFAGLVAAGLHPDPVAAGADVVTTTTHKTLGGPRGGLILCQERYAKAIDSAVFPGQQGGPLQHVIAAKAVALRIATTEAFRERQRRTLENAGAMAEALLDAGNGVRVLTGGTDVHLILVDLRESELSGQDAEDRLHDVRITVNRNAIPFDPRPPRVTSGLRIGAPALTTRGLGRDDFFEIGEIIGVALGPQFEARRAELLERVGAIVERYPLYTDLTSGAAAY